MKKKKIWIAVLAVSLAVLIGGAVFLFVFYLPNRSPSREEFAATPDATSPQDKEKEMPTEIAEPPTEAPTVDSYGYELAEYPDWTTLSFDELRELNPDIYAWIYIPGTAIDYPVVQSISDHDDSFYLDHNVYRQYQFSGSIYSETQNSTKFDDPVTVLYGHNMLNGSMFASLHNFENKEFFDNYNTAFIFTEDSLYTYLIYSVYTYDDRHILNSFNFADDKVFEEYLASTLDPHTYNGNVREGVDLDVEDRILTLSTCTNGASNTRYLVQGVLVDVQPRDAQQ